MILQLDGLALYLEDEALLWEEELQGRHIEIIMTTEIDEDQETIGEKADILKEIIRQEEELSIMKR